MEQLNWTCNNVTDGQHCVLENTSPLFTPTFSSGDIMISILLLLLFFIELVKLLRFSINKTKVVRHYQGNNSPDGKEFYQI